MNVTDGMALTALHTPKRSSSFISMAQKPGDAKLDVCQMPEPKLSGLRGHLHSEQRPLRESRQPLSKRQPPKYPRGSRAPAAFWDNLSKIWLTKEALKELDRRNIQSAQNSNDSTHRRLHRRGTRLSVAVLEYAKEYQPAADFLTRCSAACLEEVKLLARHGGPNLSELRGVSTARLAGAYADHRFSIRNLSIPFIAS